MKLLARFTVSCPKVNLIPENSIPFENSGRYFNDEALSQIKKKNARCISMFVNTEI